MAHSEFTQIAIAAAASAILSATGTIWSLNQNMSQIREDVATIRTKQEATEKNIDQMQADIHDIIDHLWTKKETK